MKKLFTMFLILALLSLGGGSALAQEPTAEPTAEPTQQPATAPTDQPTAEPAEVTVPDVVNMPQADAEAAIVAAGLTVGEVTQENSDTVPAGSVISQNPGADSSVASGSAVALVVSQGPAQVNVTVPNVVGLPQADAEAAIVAAGLITGTATLTNSDTITAGLVISQNPEADSSVASGSAVELVVSQGPILETVSAGEISSQALTNIPFTSRVGIMDMSGAGATFSLSYYNESTSGGGGGGSRGTNSGLTLSPFQMRIVDQATDSSITGGSSLKGSAVLQSSNPLAAAVFFGGTGAGGYNQFEAYDSGGFFSPGTQFFIPNVNKGVGAGKVNSEIAIQNAETSATTVNVLFVTQGVNRTFTIAPNATLYYVPKDDAGITNNLQQPVVVTSQGGKKILVINNNFRTVAPVNLSDTPGFKQSDAAAIQFLSNVHFKLNNGLSVITFIQNVSGSAVTVNVTFVKDPTCTTSACNSKPIITKNGIVIQPNEVFAINPRTDNSLPGGWSGSAKIETVPASNSIIAFGNQINTKNPNAGGYAGRAASNTTSAVFCPYVISGLPNYASSSQASTMLIQNVGSASTNVTVQFVGGAGSPNGFSTTKSPVTLAVGERLSFNFRLNNAAVNGGVPSNWFGSVRVTASGGGKVAAVTNLFNKMAGGSDTLGSYNCISQ